MNRSSVRADDMVARRRAWPSGLARRPAPTRGRPAFRIRSRSHRSGRRPRSATSLALLRAFALWATLHSALIPHEVAGSSHPDPVTPASRWPKTLLAGQIPVYPAQPASARTGLSRRRSRVRVPSLPRRKYPPIGMFWRRGRHRQPAAFWAVPLIPHPVPACDPIQYKRWKSGRSVLLV